MMRRYACFFLALLIVALTAYGVNAESPTPADTTAAGPTLDSVTLKDGTVIYGRVLGMIADELHIKTGFGPTAGDDIVKIMWPNVAKLVVNRPIPFTLKEGTTVVGTAQPGEPGTLTLQAAPMGTPMAIPLDAVVGPVGRIAHPGQVQRLVELVAAEGDHQGLDAARAEGDQEEAEVEPVFVVHERGQ